ncbi:expressed unknown protein [Seminavis robusta]|uniref:Uncharacterized protein n=1 Tax=Seminavis robusta TaxID=568900 RepID=A0A9N8ER67_9STRA|nr:expressed unknown protein [Seminavis robusta]|eukprot:Sro1554_g282020.1 n/a (482) ;mRNA; f:7928-9373
MEDAVGHDETDHASAEEELHSQPQSMTSVDAIASTLEEPPSSSSIHPAMQVDFDMNMRNNPLSSFLMGLLQENTSLDQLDVTIITDNAAILPDKYTESRHLLEARNSSSLSSISELSRWESHVVRTPPPQPERTDEKAAWHASPTRPQRRTSFEVDRSHNKLLDEADSNSCRRALSQSLNQLETLAPEDVQEVSMKKKLPPRVPIRRTSGRVHSPPPEGPGRTAELEMKNARRRSFTVEEQADDIDDSNGSFQLEFSESEHNDDSEHIDIDRRERGAASVDHPSVQSVVRDIQSLGVNRDQAPTHLKRRVSSDFSHVRDSATITSSQSDSKCTRGRNRGRHRRTSSMNDDGLPILESFPNHPPHLRVLPRQTGTLRLLLEANSNNLDNEERKQTNTAPTTEAGGELDMLTKVASSKMLPSRRSFDVGERKPQQADDAFESPEEKSAGRKGLLKRVKHKVAKTVQRKTANSKEPASESPASS